MGDERATCPKCGKAMQRGHLPDVAHGQVLQGTWASGDPEPRTFIGGIKWKRKEQVPLTAYRCTSCGFVELYARAE